MHSLCVGWRNLCLFPVSCAAVKFFFLVGIRFWFFILLMYLEYHKVVVLCQFFWFWREIVFAVTQCTIQSCGCVSFLGKNRFQFYILMYLEYNTVVVLCQFFGSGGKQFLTFCTYLLYNTFVRLCHFFGCGRKQFSK